MKCRWLALALLLAGCSQAGHWSKPGVDASAAAHDYEQCRAVAAAATRTETAIDQDIFASRHSDLQRASIVRNEAQNIADETRDRGSAIIASCMQSKGFTQPR